MYRSGAPSEAQPPFPQPLPWQEEPPTLSSRMKETGHHRWFLGPTVSNPSKNEDLEKRGRFVWRLRCIGDLERVVLQRRLTRADFTGQRCKLQASSVRLEAGAC